MKKIVMIGHEPLTKRTKSIFYIEDFIQAGVEFEYWDISQYIFPGMRLIKEVEAPYIRKFSQLWQCYPYHDQKRHGGYNRGS